jgi:HSP20 family protein
MKTQKNATSVAQRESTTDGVTRAERVEYVLPVVNIYATEDGYQLEADMPGVTKDGLEISLDRNELTLVGHRNPAGVETCHYRESSDGDFRRVFELDPEIDTDKITARVENGVLHLTLARREQLKPRKIAVVD